MNPFALTSSQDLLNNYAVATGTTATSPAAATAMESLKNNLFSSILVDHSKILENWVERNVNNILADLYMNVILIGDWVIKFFIR